MKRSSYILAILTFVFAFSTSLECRAQQASSLEQLQVLVKPGDSIYITNSSGATVKGRLSDLTPSSLRLIVNGTSRDFAQPDIREIRQWRGDSLKNGALIGAGVAAGLSTTAAIICGVEGECGSGMAVAAVAFYTGIGAAIGVGIDALIPSKRTVYRSLNASISKTLDIRPIVSRSNKGVKVAFSF